LIIARRDAHASQPKNQESIICRAVMKREIIVCSFWLLLSLYLSVESYRLGLSTANRPGPGFFPCIATIGIGLIAAFRLINNIRKRAPGSHTEPGIGGEAWLVLCVIAGMIAYAFLLEPLGFLFCTFLLVAVYLKVIAARRWLVTLSFAAAVALASHFFFAVLLKAELPKGLLIWLV
jgi:putative tricarboxylic transport membrane protein